MAETVGSDQVDSLKKDLSSLQAQVKAAKKLNEADPAIAKAEEHIKDLTKRIDNMKVGKTLVGDYTKLRTELTATMKADAKALKAVKAPGKSGPVDLGIAKLTKSEAAIKRLEELAKGDLKGELILKDGDGKHADSKLWRFAGEDGSLPTTAHTKGAGDKNEKAALTALKKAFKNAGYV